MSFEDDSPHRDVRPIFDFKAYSHSAVGGFLAMNLHPRPRMAQLGKRRSDDVCNVC